LLADIVKMSVRHLDRLFQPRSVALIGATARVGSVGAVVMRNLCRAGFAGELMPVNPHHSVIDGRTVYPDIASLPQAPDLAVIVTPPETVPALIGKLGERGTRAAVVITAGEVPFRGRATLLRRIGQVQNGKIQASGQVD
jgi:acetyltransferase